VVNVSELSLTIPYSSTGQYSGKLAYVTEDTTVWYQRRDNIALASAWTDPVTPMAVTGNGRGVSIMDRSSPTGASLFVLQADPQ
jgi:hypothetical protein